VTPPKVRFERRDGRLVEVVSTGGPRVRVEELTKDHSDVHPELKGERILHETYPADEAWGDDLGHSNEIGKVDGELVGEFPRRSRLGDAMADAGLDAEQVGQAAALPAAVVSRLVETGEVPGDDQRRQLEAVLTDPFPERREALSMAEQIGGTSTATNDAAEAAAAERSKRRDQFARERTQALQRRRREAEQRRRNLDSGLSRVSARIDALWERLNR
jgi:hypothetical protein